MDEDPANSHACTLPAGADNPTNDILDCAAQSILRLLKARRYTPINCTTISFSWSAEGAWCGPNDVSMQHSIDGTFVEVSPMSAFVVYPFQDDVPWTWKPRFWNALGIEFWMDMDWRGALRSFQLRGTSYFCPPAKITWQPCAEVDEDEKD